MPVITPVPYPWVPDPDELAACHLYSQFCANQPAAFAAIMDSLAKTYSLWDAPLPIVQRVIDKLGVAFWGMCQTHFNLALLMLTATVGNGKSPASYSFYHLQADRTYLPGLPAGITLTPDPTDPMTGGQPTMRPIAVLTPPPSGYSIAFDKPLYDATNNTTATLTITGATAGLAFAYTITDSHGGIVTGSGTIAAATEALANINLSTLADGGIQVALVLTEPAPWARSGGPTTATAILAAQPAPGA